MDLHVFPIPIPPPTSLPLHFFVLFFLSSSKVLVSLLTLPSVDIVGEGEGGFDPLPVSLEEEQAGTVLDSG